MTLLQSIDIMNLLGVISLTLGLVALVFAIYQTVKSNEQSKYLDSISGSLSTQYIGEFPDYLSIVTQIIEEAETEVRIIKTVPIQGYFSNHILWVNYSHTLERKSRLGTKIKVICLDEIGRKKRIQLQFYKEENEWVEWRNNNQEKIKEFSQYRFPNINTQAISNNEFIHLLLKTQNDLIRESFIHKGIETIEINQIIPVQAWIVDSKKAVFTIQTLPLQTVGHAFLTSDPRIVAALHQMTKYFTSETKTNFDMYSRIDKIIVTKDLNQSIELYKDILDLEMRSLSNPVAIFKYDFISFYVYKDSFFKEQFGFDYIGDGGMLSIEIEANDSLKELKKNLKTKSHLFTEVSEQNYRYIVKDFNNLTLELWVNPQKK